MKLSEKIDRYIQGHEDIGELCGICDADEATKEVHCSLCKREHKLCSMCFDLGHNHEKGVYWDKN